MLEEIQTLEGHTDRVWALAWNPTGTILASCGTDKTIRLWVEKDAGKWSCASILTETHRKSIRRLSWSPCGNYLASASFDSTVCIWKRSLVDNTWSVAVNLEGHESEVKSIAWSHDGQYLASCGRDRTVWIWERASSAIELDGDEGDTDDAENWDCSDVKNNHSKDVKHIVWHPLHNILVSASYDDTVKLFHKDGEDWCCFDTLLAHSSTVWSADFSASGEYLVTCSDDKTVRIWKNHAHNELPGVMANSWKCTSVIQGYHSRSIYDVSWSKSMDVVASVSGDNSIAIYERDISNAQSSDIFTCSQKLSQAHRCDANAVAWNPRKPSMLASAGDDRLIKIWNYSRDDLQGTKALTIFEEIMRHLSQTSISCQSDAIIEITDHTNMTLKIDNFATLFTIVTNLQTLQSELCTDEEKQQLSKELDFEFSKDDARPVRISNHKFDEITGSTKQFTIDLLDQSDNIKHKFTLLANQVESDNFNLVLPRRSVKIVTSSNELFLYEKTGDLFKILPTGRSEFLLGHLFSFSDVQFVVDKSTTKLKYVISADRDEKIRITNYPNTSDIERYCFGHKSYLSRIFVSASHDRFASIDQHNEVCIWDLEHLSRDKQKPLTPSSMISINNETVKKRLCVR